MQVKEPERAQWCRHARIRRRSRSFMNNRVKSGFSYDDFLASYYAVLPLREPNNMVGETISHYHILKELSHGGMGTVFLAQDTNLPRKVALKFIRGEKQQDPAMRKRFLKEADSAAAIVHPFICTVYETGEFEGAIFIAMEYLEGHTLQKRLAQGPLSLKKALNIAAETAEALEEIHRVGIIHRDLKPSNIMLIRQDHVKVMDFGLASPSPENKEASSDAVTLSLYSGVAGTFYYMSPEQLCGEVPDHRSDIFSFGIVLYEMLTGVHPFRRNEENRVVSLILQSNPPPLSKYLEDAPELLEHTLNRMLAKDPSCRYQSVHEVRTDLAQILESPGQSAAAIPDRPAIAVLPFVDMSPNKDQDYFCEGMAEELINALVKLENLFVAARTSAFHFKNSGLDIREIGRQLNVRTILEGSVRKSGENLRIGVELTNVEDGYEIWSQSFDRMLDDVFAIQDEISRAIVEKLKVSLFPPSPINGKAYELYLKGRFCWNKRTEEGLLKSVEHFEQAIKLDGHYALVWAGLAASYVTLSIYGVKPPLEAMPAAKTAAGKALGHNPRLALALASLGCVRSMYDWNWTAAENDFKSAIGIEPKNENAHHWYATNYLAPLARFDEARSELEIARKIDPLNLVINTSLGLQYYFERQYDQAIKEHLKTLEMDQNFGLAFYFLGQAYVQKGVFGKAIAALEHAVLLSGHSPETKAALGHAYAMAGKKVKALTVLKELKKLSAGRYVSPVLIAQICISLEDWEEAFKHLDRAYEWRSTDLIWIKTRPVYDGIRSDSRYVNLCKRIGLPE
jgi:eukaryotic-like serine/threonine-protein kinase